MKLVFFGDVVGKPGRRAVCQRARQVSAREGADFIVANGENVAGGIGIDPGSAKELHAAGVDVLTSGNHVWSKREIYPYLDASERILRPTNFAPEAPGRGWGIFEVGECSVAVINLIGRVFMGPADCPFRAVDAVLERIGDDAKVILVDFHGEATSEKSAMAHYLDGRVSAVVGSHTHVQTCDERVLPGGTAFITDAGMCGPEESVIGMRTELVVQRFRDQLPVRFEVARGTALLQGVVIDVDESSGRGREISRIRERVDAGASAA